MPIETCEICGKVTSQINYIDRTDQYLLSFLACFECSENMIAVFLNVKNIIKVFDNKEGV